MPGTPYGGASNHPSGDQGWSRQTPQPPTGSYGGGARPGWQQGPSSGSASVGRASGSASVGRASGSASVGGAGGRASVGSASVGSASVGSASVG